MEITLPRRAFSGALRAVPSKSALHRLMICAALSDRPSLLPAFSFSGDLAATADCLHALGARVTEEDGGVRIRPIEAPPAHCVLPCGESGSTLRFLLPVAGALGCSAEFRMAGRLPERPMEPLCEALRENGMQISRGGSTLRCSGQLHGGRFPLPGNVSSQFFSGLLLALPLLPQPSLLAASSEPESRSYLHMTLNILRRCGVSVFFSEGGFTVPGNQRPRLPEGLSLPGDCSDAAVFLCGGALGGSVTVSGLADGEDRRALCALLSRFGAAVTVTGDCVTAERRPLRGTVIDASDIPDLIPPLAVLAAAAGGETVIRNAARLRLKESDRLRALRKLLESLGCPVSEQPDGLRIQGVGTLRGGAACCTHDHRIAMAAALCSLISENPVVITGAECTEKSHPGFFDAFLALQKEDAP